MFDWGEFLRLANELAARSDDEAALRSAVSRAYYAAFCKARQMLINEGVADAKSTHKFVWAKYSQDGDRSRRKIGLEGDRLKKDRVAADYQQTVPNLAATVQDSLRRARDLIDALQGL